MLPGTHFNAWMLNRTQGGYPDKYYGKAIRFGEGDVPMMRTFGLPRNILVDVCCLTPVCLDSTLITIRVVPNIVDAKFGITEDDRICR